MMRRSHVWLAAALLALPGAGRGEGFSADAVMSLEDGQRATARLYVDDGRMRKEYQYLGEPVVEILDTRRGISLMCFRSQRTCFENESLERLELGAERRFPADPCEGSEQLRCSELGVESVNGRQAVKWAIEGDFQGREVVTHQWIDRKTHVPLRRELPDGSLIELIDRGHERVNGRETDKWEVVARYADGTRQVFYQWYDRELGIAIRQEHPDGGTQELRNIMVGRVPGRLFEPPPGFQTVQGQEAARLGTGR